MNERYEITQLIAKDQVGGLYLAEDSTLGRKVDFRNFERANGEEMLSEANDEFSKFSGKLTALQHPNLITIFDIAFDDGEAYMVMQHIAEESLADRLKEGPLLQNRVYEMASDVLEALHAAHDSGVIHGALNTQSIRRIPKASGGYRHIVVDMGLNHLAMIIRGAAGGIVDPILMSPEVHDGSDPDERSDLFMLGQLCYTALIGGHPFAENTIEECAELYKNDGLPPITNFVSDVQEDFVEWIRHLAKGDPEQRPANALEAMKLLSHIKLIDPQPAAPANVLMTPPVTASATATAPMAATTPMTATTPMAPAAAPAQAVAPAQMQPRTESKPVTISTDTGNKKPMIIIASLAAAILVFIGIMQLIKPGGDSGKAGAGDLTEVPEGVKVHLHSVKPMGSDPIDLEGESTLDWSVSTGNPVASMRQRRKEGKYISNILKVGEFSEWANTKHIIKYKAGAKAFNSMGHTTFSKPAKSGDGWEVYMRVPRTHKGPLLINFYLLHINCGFNASVNAAKVNKPINFTFDAGDAGKSKVLLEIPKPVPGGFYTFKFVMGKTQTGKPGIFGMSAIEVLKK